MIRFQSRRNSLVGNDANTLFVTELEYLLRAETSLLMIILCSGRPFLQEREEYPLSVQSSLEVQSTVLTLMGSRRAEASCISWESVTCIHDHASLEISRPVTQKMRQAVSNTHPKPFAPDALCRDEALCFFLCLFALCAESLVFCARCRPQGSTACFAGERHR